MKFCISFGKFELKYFFYCVLFSIIEICIYYFVYNDNDIIINKHCLFHSFCYFLGYLLNFIPAWISHAKTKEKERPITNKVKEGKLLSIEYIYNEPYEKYLSIKDIIIFFFICLILLLADLMENVKTKTDDDKHYSDDFIFIKFLVFFFVLKFGNEVYYKHQYISFFILILIEIIKYIYLNKIHTSFIIQISLNFIFSFLYAIHFLYIKRLMEYKFISPGK